MHDLNAKNYRTLVHYKNLIFLWTSLLKVKSDLAETKNHIEYNMRAYT
ncbi:hypothetical protein QE380_003317 [Acinetobacter baylyi]|uniref:Uncharacterized protein n=1 Tax=Acinetobacter baylyi TaxID=202950 RepID=A0ABU0V0R1_ACIBI|nr:hypothetical protein [Acinetobacter baylyi]MDR6106010.1 hypothetical protein [Acinetobacter baylyi]MDR6187266.1 hypothetical protein [Acinetobacter baylyi]